MLYGKEPLTGKRRIYSICFGFMFLAGFYYDNKPPAWIKALPDKRFIYSILTAFLPKGIVMSPKSAVFLIGEVTR